MTLTMLIVCVCVCVWVCVLKEGSLSLAYEFG